MDLIKIGKFLSELRHEQGLTQEQLGEKLGVTNKTVSRWENGNYMPPVEMLQLMSGIYSVSINEILSGERLSEEEYRVKAEENIKSALGSAFSVKDRLEFFKDKWRKEHRGSFAAWIVVVAAVVVLGGIFMVVWENEQVGFLLWGAAVILGAIVRIGRYNKMMAYAEGRAFDGKG